MGLGNNQYGQLGDGTTVIKNTPIQIDTSHNWLSASAGNAHTLATKTDSTLWVWGSNKAYQLGDGTTIQRNNPVQISNLGKLKSAVAGDSCSVSINANDSLIVWGDNKYGQLGDGTLINKHNPATINCPYPLPIILNDFQANKVNNTVVLKWETITEINSKLFEVQKSEDSKTFTTIGSVEAKGKAGEYQFIDKLTANSIIQTTVYYRLKQIDNDGKFSFSVIRAVSIKQEVFNVSITPNPAKNIVMINTNISNSYVVMTDLTGNAMLVKKIEDFHTKIDVSTIAKGVYLFTVVTNQGKKTQKVILE